MSKIFFKSIIKSKNNGTLNIKGKGIKKNNNILFYDNGIKVTVELSLDKVILTRCSSNYNLRLIFDKYKKTETTYEIKELGQFIKLETITSDLNISKNKIKINYDLYMNGEYSDNFIYELEWGDKE